MALYGLYVPAGHGSMLVDASGQKNLKHATRGRGCAGYMRLMGSVFLALELCYSLSSVPRPIFTAPTAVKLQTPSLATITVEDAVRTFQAAGKPFTTTRAFTSLRLGNKPLASPIHSLPSGAIHGIIRVPSRATKGERPRRLYLSRPKIESRTIQPHPGGQSSHWASVYSDVEFEKVPAGQG